MYGHWHCWTFAQFQITISAFRAKDADVKMQRVDLQICTWNLNYVPGPASPALIRCLYLKKKNMEHVLAELIDVTSVHSS